MDQDLKSFVRNAGVGMLTVTVVLAILSGIGWLFNLVISAAGLDQQKLLPVVFLPLLAIAGILVIVATVVTLGTIGNFLSDVGKLMIELMSREFSERDRPKSRAKADSADPRPTP